MEKQSHMRVYVLSPFQHTSTEVMLLTLGSICVASSLKDVYTCLCHQAELRLFRVSESDQAAISHAIQQLCSHRGLSSLPS